MSERGVDVFIARRRQSGPSQLPKLYHVLVTVAAALCLHCEDSPLISWKARPNPYKVANITMSSGLKFLRMALGLHSILNQDTRRHVTRIRYT